MDDNSIFQIYFNCDFKTKEQIYDFITEIACQHTSSQQKNNILYQFKEREKVGSSLIAEHVLLPHIESEYLIESQILLFKLTSPMNWDKNIQDIQIVIAILLKKDEEEEIKKKITIFTRSLANENFIDYLLNTEEKSDFEEQIIKFQEDSL